MTHNSTVWAIMAILAFASSGACANPPRVVQTPKPAQPSPEQALEPLLQYLRCEPVALDQFGQAQRPSSAFNYVASTRVSAESPQEHLMLTVWPGVTAQVQVMAGYGFFGMLQFYNLDQRNALMKALGDAGWAMQRKPTAKAGGRYGGRGPGLERLYATYEATQPMGALTRRMTLVEARIDPLTEQINLDGVTLFCTYDKPDQR